MYRYLLLTNEQGESVAVFMDKIVCIDTKDANAGLTTCKTDITLMDACDALSVREPVAIVLDKVKSLNESYHSHR